jgi:hypothetical protein
MIDDALFHRQLLILDVVRSAEEPVRKSDVLKSVNGSTQSLVSAMSECVAEGWLICEQVKGSGGRPVDFLSITSPGKMMLAQKHAELVFARENPIQKRNRLSRKEKEKIVVESLQEVVTTDTVVAANSQQDVLWVDHVFHQQDLHWQGFIATPEIIDAYGGQAVEMARFYAAKYGEKVVTLESTLRKNAPEDWALFTVEQVAMILTVATMCNCVRSTFFYDPEDKENRPLVNWYHWHVVAEAPVLEWVAATGRENVLAMYSYWGQNLY